MTLEELATHHEKQADYFASLGPKNALTEFHTKAALVIRDAIKWLNNCAASS